MDFLTWEGRYDTCWYDSLFLRTFQIMMSYQFLVFCAVWERMWWRWRSLLSSIGGQNSSSNLFLGSEPHFRTLVWLRKKWGKWHRIYLGSANGAYVHLVFSYSSLAILLTIEWRGFYIGYMGNTERGKQVIEFNLNGLGPNTIWHHTSSFLPLHLSGCDLFAEPLLNVLCMYLRPSSL